MILRNEIRIGRARVERRVRRLSLRGWTLLPGRSESVELGAVEALPEVLKAWQRPGRGKVLGRCRLVVDDTLLQYAVVPGLPDARSIGDFRMAASLRCEALFGWAGDNWVVSAATPPTTGPTLVCAARRGDVARWEDASRLLRTGRAAVTSAAIDAIDSVRRRIPNDCRVLALSREGAVGFLVQNGAVAAVVQDRDTACGNWDEESAANWLKAQTALTESWQRTDAVVLIDLRDWSRGCIVHERRLQ